MFVCMCNVHAHLRTKRYLLFAQGTFFTHVTPIHPHNLILDVRELEPTQMNRAISGGKRKIMTKMFSLEKSLWIKI